MQRRPFTLSIAWAIALAVVTAVTLPSQFLTADVLLHSVMSLQKVTLYYWGQDRLLNVLPLAIAWISNPTANLAATLLLSSLCFYLLLFALARLASAAVGTADVDGLALKTFVLVSAAFLAASTPIAVFDIAVGHIEFSLPALLLVLAVHASVLGTRPSLPSLLATAASCFIATGVNPASVIPGLLIAAGAALYRKRVGFGELSLAGSCLVGFAVWTYVAGLHGESRYATFDLAIMRDGLPRAVALMTGALDLTSLVLMLGVLALAKGALVLGRDGPAGDSGRWLADYLRCGAVVFSVAWLLLFSGNQWVEASGFAWRYFIFIAFAVLFVASISIATVLKSIKPVASGTIAGAAAILTLALTFPAPAAFKDYKVFREVATMARPGIHLYSGDYWRVWPAVLRDMMNGHEAYGLTFRGGANGLAARAYMLRRMRSDGQVSVLCLDAPADECRRQIEAIVGPMPLIREATLARTTYEIVLGGLQGQVDYRGTSFLRLPSQVGAAEGDSRRSDGRSGFLVFGPYAVVPSGRYRLDVFGSADAMGGAYAEVVSDKGTKVHGRFPLAAASGGTLLNGARLQIAEDAVGVEVRVWVSGESRLRLTGYRLSRD